MTEQNNVLMLKKLAAKIEGGGKTSDDISGDTIAEVLDIIQQHYTSGGAGVTIVSAELNVDGNGNFDNGLIIMSDGSTVDIVISEIEALTLTSAEGSGLGKTIITVSPALEEGDQYRYKLGSVTKPAKNQDVTDWTAWDGTSEITADSGDILTLVECTAENRAVKCGSVEVQAPLF